MVANPKLQYAEVTARWHNRYLACSIFFFLTTALFSGLFGDYYSAWKNRAPCDDGEHWVYGNGTDFDDACHIVGDDGLYAIPGAKCASECEAWWHSKHPVHRLSFPNPGSPGTVTTTVDVTLDVSNMPKGCENLPAASDPRARDGVGPESSTATSDDYDAKRVFPRTGTYPSPGDTFCECLVLYGHVTIISNQQSRAEYQSVSIEDCDTLPTWIAYRKQYCLDPNNPKVTTTLYKNYYITCSNAPHSQNAAKVQKNDGR